MVNPYGLFLTMAGMITTADTMTDVDQDIVAMDMGTGHGDHLGDMNISNNIYDRKNFPDKRQT